MKFTCFLVLFLFSIGLIAQENPIFTLGDQNQVYNNPAFTGTANSFRLGHSYRNTWPALSGNFISNCTYVDQYLGKYGGGGISYTSDKYGYYLKKAITLSYSYGFNIGSTSTLQLGIAPSIIHSSNTYYSYTFAINSPTVFLDSNAFGRNFNLSAGAVFYNHLFFVGYALHNINQPVVVPYYDVSSKEYHLPFRHSLQAGLYGRIGKNIQINLLGSAHLLTGNSLIGSTQWQDHFYQVSQLIQVKTKHLLVGAGYKTKNTFLTRLGIVYDHFRIIYGYDVSISKLSNASAGSHEFTLQVLLNFNKNSNPNPITY